MTDRKTAEALFHDRLRAIYETEPERYSRYTANRKYYSVVRRSVEHAERWMAEHCRGRQVLDFGCGDGRYSFKLAAWADSVLGIDISPESVAICRRRARELGVDHKVRFEVMDCENLALPSQSMDVVVEMGVLHHLDVHKAFGEMRRVLRPGGVAYCAEALVHNPFIQAYRLLTPKLRTEWEARHILGRREIEAARRSFGAVDLTFFHLAVLGAVPLRSTPIFDRCLWWLERADDLVLRIPGLKWWAWQVHVVLRDPVPAGGRAS